MILFKRQPLLESIIFGITPRAKITHIETTVPKTFELTYKGESFSVRDDDDFIKPLPFFLLSQLRNAVRR